MLLLKIIKKDIPRKNTRRIQTTEHRNNGKTLQHRRRYQEKRAKFCKHINRVPEHWLAKRLMDWVKNLKATTNWQKKNLQGDLKSARITDTDIKDRHAYRRKIREW